MGGSCSGKSTVLAALREHFRGVQGVVFPTRLTTRPARIDDKPWENRPVSPALLNRYESQGRLLMRWTKPIPGQGEEHYAFCATTGGFIVLGGNDALVTNSESIRPSPRVLDHLIKVLIFASPTVRAERIRRRSPQILDRPAERRTRLRDDSVQLRSRVDYVYDNNADTTPLDVSELVSVVEAQLGREGEYP